MTGKAICLLCQPFCQTGGTRHHDNRGNATTGKTSANNVRCASCARQEARQADTATGQKQHQRTRPPEATTARWANALRRVVLPVCDEAATATATGQKTGTNAQQRRHGLNTDREPDRQQYQKQRQDNGQRFAGRAPRMRPRSTPEAARSHERKPANPPTKERKPANAKTPRSNERQQPRQTLPTDEARSGKTTGGRPEDTPPHPPTGANPMNLPRPEDTTTKPEATATPSPRRPSNPMNLRTPEAARARPQRFSLQEDTPTAQDGSSPKPYRMTQARATATPSKEARSDNRQRQEARKPHRTKNGQRHGARCSTFNPEPDHQKQPDEPRETPYKPRKPRSSQAKAREHAHRLRFLSPVCFMDEADRATAAQRRHVCPSG